MIQVNTTGFSRVPSTVRLPSTMMPANGLKRKTHPSRIVALLSAGMVRFSSTRNGLPDCSSVMPPIFPERSVRACATEAPSKTKIIRSRNFIRCRFFKKRFRKNADGFSSCELLMFTVVSIIIYSFQSPILTNAA